ncbi:hypothetical protein C8N36_10588 [Pelagimonas varians]|uniref:MetA-pathway of phenol degradation n=1 Tax=Pelagimonas varians TaxID=696760 RepID=A0A238KBQ6_9RHOB|nr:hypothetical protein C8N36_10588 [Pelagimonas varians]SMX39486.1 hypothetical protein PEV8663_01730 [Pelagimonas varians]
MKQLFKKIRFLTESGKQHCHYKDTQNIASKRVSLLGLFSCLLGLPSLAAAQEFQQINNGTNPTLLTTQAGLQYQLNRVNTNLDTGLLEAFYTRPFGDGSKAIRFNVPFSDVPAGEGLTFGDFSVTYIDVFHLTENNGAAFTFELFLDTAEKETAGYGQIAGETSVFYAWFLKNGSIFAPAWVQTFGLEGGNDQGQSLNTSTFDFYYVPKLANSKYYMTFDPAIIHDWESEKTFGSLQVTMGMLTGKAFGGDGQVFIKPGVLFGADKPADWSFQVGYKVLNF